MVKILKILYKFLKITFIFFIAIAILFFILCLFHFPIIQKFQQFIISDDFTSVLFQVIATLLFASIALTQLEDIENTNSADFIHKLKNDFFEEKTRILLTLIDLKAIKFIDNGNTAYFEVIEDAPRLKDLPDDIKRNLTEKKFYTLHEIDDFLLGHFEDIGLFEQKRILDIEMVYEEFSWYIETAYENCEIKQYIEYSRKDDKDKDVYDKFEYIYYKCKSFGKCKLGSKSKFIWKLKWWIKGILKID
jgi:hypothetical protein